MPLSSLALPSPVGLLTLVAGESGLRAVLWENERTGRVVLPPHTQDPAHAVLIETKRQIEEYFAGTRTEFSLPLDLHGTDFQKTVWSVLSSIPFGETRSYGDIARQIGCPAAVRAVGAANGRNPLSIVLPCHRVIGAAGALTGFAGGLGAKTWLLDHEARFVSGTQPRLFA